MDIIKSNFAKLLPLVKDAIDGCDFLAIDTELTGLSTEVTEHAFDSIAERYSKLRENCMKFIIIQFGLSTFKYHPKQNKYTHQDFNFYVFPRPHIRQAPDPKFMCQTSSFHFLASQGFDFNRVIYEGIPYLSPDPEHKMKDFLENKHKSEQDALKGSNNGSKANGQKEVEVPEEHKQFIAEIHERVESFLSNDSETTIRLDPCTPYQRKLIYDTVQQKHQTGIEVSSVLNANNQRVVAIVKTTEEERHERLNLKQINDIGDLDAAVGFRKVLDHVSESRKLVIGHNMLLDMMHTMDQFFSPIPEQVEEFKEMLHSIFPQIMDTKVLASSEKLRPFFDSTQLGEVVKTLQGKAFEMPIIECDKGFKGYNLQSNKAHEAGFDAFMSGFSYIGMMNKLAAMQNLPLQYAEPSSKILSSYANRMFIMRHYDIHTLDVCAPDQTMDKFSKKKKYEIHRNSSTQIFMVENTGNENKANPDRNNVFYVSFPEEWKTIDLVELFLPYGNIYVNWLDNVSALVALKNKDNAINVKSNLLNKTSRLYTVRSFSEYQKAMTKQTVAKKSMEVKRTQTSILNSEPSCSKRRASGSAESMELIPEADENEAERADDSVSTSHESKEPSVKSKASSSEGPSSKRQKRFHQENDAEVTSTAKVFEEENIW